MGWIGWTLLFLALSCYCSGVRSQPSLTQPPSQSVSPGQTIKLSCTAQGNLAHTHWHRQRFGQGPAFVLTGADTRGQGIPNRFTGAKTGNVHYLVISNAQAEDEADYYCCSWDSSASQWIFGGGTQLTLTGQPASPPTVNLFLPSAEERQSKNKATLVCLMDSFNPGVVTVTWQADGATITNGVETTKPTKLNDKYVAASYLTLDKAEWERHEEYTCKVTHEGSPYTKTINRSQCA